MTDAQAELLLEEMRAARALQEQALAELRTLARQRPRTNIEALAYSKRRAERLLGIHRSLLSAHVRAGTIRTVPWGKGGCRILKSEIDRLLADGLPALPEERERVLPPGTRRRAPGPRTKRSSEKKHEGSIGDAIRALEI